MCTARTMIELNTHTVTHQIHKLDCFSSRLAFVIAQSNEARCSVENEDVVGAAPTGDAPTTSEWSTISLPTNVRLILDTWWLASARGNYHIRDLGVTISEDATFSKYISEKIATITVFKIRSETCRNETQFCENLYMIKKESLPDRHKFCRSISAVRHLFWRLP